MKQVEERYISLLTDFGFDRLFEEAEIAKFTPQEMREYETSKMAYRDIKNSVDTAKREGIAEGMEKGMELGMAKGKQEGLAEGMEKGMEKVEQKASMRPTQKQHNDCWQWDFLPNRFPKLPSYLWKSLRI